MISYVFSFYSKSYLYVLITHDKFTYFSEKSDGALANAATPSETEAGSESETSFRYNT